MRYRVFQQDFPEAEPNGVDVCIFETDDKAEAEREAQELSVPGNTAWVVDTGAPKGWSVSAPRTIKPAPRLPLSGYGRRY